MVAMSETAAIRTIPRGPAGPPSPPPIPEWSDDYFLSFVDSDGNRLSTPKNLAGPAGPIGDAQVFKTRMQAAASSINVLFSAIVLQRFDAGSHLAPAYYRPGTSDGPLAFQDVNGNWWELAKQSLNQFMFGAVGDGDGLGSGTNDTVRLQTALNAAGTLGCELDLIPATHRCDGGLTVPAGLKINAYGAALDFRPAGNVTGLNFVNGGFIAGAKIIGAGNAVMNANGKAVACSGVNNAPAAPTFTAAPVLRDCIIDGWSGYGVNFSYVNGGLVSGCHITNVGYAGIGGVSCNDTIVDGNLIDGVAPGTVDAYGIFLDREDGTSEISDPRSYRAAITNNVVKNVRSVPGNNGQGIDTHGGVDFRIIGNTVLDCEVGIFVTSSAISGVVKLAPKRCIVKGNTVSSSLYVGQGIVVAGAYDGSVIQDYADGCIVSGNTVTGHGVAGDVLSGGIFAIGTNALILSGNSVKAPRCNGIFLNKSNIGFSISGNTITDPHDTTHVTPSCITVYGSDNRGYIGGNTLRYEDPSLNTYVAVYSIWVASGLSGLDLEIDRHSFLGIAAGHLSYFEETTTGVNAANLMVQRGRITIPLSNVASVTAAVATRRFPVPEPHVFLSHRGAPTPGTVGKAARVEYDPSSLSATGFNIVARPYDSSTFGGSGNLEIEWMAMT